MFFRIFLFGWTAVGVSATLLAGLPSFTHEFAQVGDGGGVRSVFLVLNQNAVEVTINLEFFRDDGTPLTLTIGETTRPIRGRKRVNEIHTTLHKSTSTSIIV